MLISLSLSVAGITPEGRVQVHSSLILSSSTSKLFQAGGKAAGQAGSRATHTGPTWASHTRTGHGSTEDLRDTRTYRRIPQCICKRRSRRPGRVQSPRHDSFRTKLSRGTKRGKERKQETKKRREER